MDKGLHTGMILVDLQKAFDTWDQDVLLEKIECMGFKKPVIKWVKYYLPNRKFFVLLEGDFSEEGLITCWVLQGSVLGRLLFLIYINGIPQALSQTVSNIYADDICIYYEYKDIQKIETVLNKEFSSLCESLREKCLNTEFFWSVFSLIRTEYRIHSECRKIRTKKNSVFRQSSCSEWFLGNKFQFILEKIKQNQSFY